MRKPNSLSVLMVIQNYLPWPGGTERQLAALAAQLDLRHVHVEVMTEQRRLEWPLADEIAGIRVHRLPYPKIRWLGTGVLLVRVMHFLLTRGRRFDIFHAHGLDFLAVVTVIIGRLLGKVVMLKAVGGWELEHGVLNPTRLQRFSYRAMLAILCRADTWIAISTHMRRAMEAAGVPPGRIVTIPNGVDTVRFDRACAARVPQGRNPSQTPRVVFIGRLVKEKALPVLLNAWTIVVQRIPGTVLDIVGWGPLEQELKTLTKRLGLTASVRFQGYHENVIPFLQAANLFVLPSYVEGLSNTLLEAMALSVPVVATRISGSEDMITDGETGVLVPPGDAAALAQALSELLAEPERACAMGHRARQRVLELCSLEQVTTSYIQLYQHLLKENGERLCVASPAS